MEQSEAEVFLQAAQTKKFKEVFHGVFKRLADLDCMINQVYLPSCLPLHAQRVKVLFQDYLWQIRPKVDEFGSQVKAVVCTADILRKHLQGKPAWLKNRKLQLLIHDEIECARVTELAALTLHFDCCITAGDPCQAIPYTRGSPSRVPPIDPQLAATHSEAISSCTPLEYTEAPAFKHLVKHSNNVYLEGVRRYGQSVIQLLEKIDLVKPNKWHSVADYKTDVHLVRLQLAWNPAHNTCFACSPLFTALITLARAWVQADTTSTIAIVMLYKKSIELMRKLVRLLDEAGMCCFFLIAARCFFFVASTGPRAAHLRL
jgi:hypothetical protein